mgnify:CR=1 FL=1
MRSLGWTVPTGQSATLPGSLTKDTSVLSNHFSGARFICIPIKSPAATAIAEMSPVIENMNKAQVGAFTFPSASQIYDQDGGLYVV